MPCPREKVPTLPRTVPPSGRLPCPPCAAFSQPLENSPCSPCFPTSLKHLPSDHLSLRLSLPAGMLGCWVGPSDWAGCQRKGKGLSTHQKCVSIATKGGRLEAGTNTWFAYLTTYQSSWMSLDEETMLFLNSRIRRLSIQLHMVISN